MTLEIKLLPHEHDNDFKVHRLVINGVPVLPADLASITRLENLETKIYLAEIKEAEKVGE